MTKNELELIDLILKSEQPEQTLIKAATIINDLYLQENCSLRSSETPQTTDQNE